MTEEHDLGAGLTARIAPPSASGPARLDIVFPGRSSGLRFERATGHSRARLAYGGWRAVPDVSSQPGAIVRQLHLTAREHAVDPNRWQHLVLGALRTWHGSLDWCQHLLAALGAITHPLLAPVYERGHTPAAELPRWAVAILRQHTAADAAAALCSAPTRRVTRSLAASLVHRPPHEHLDFTPLGWAVAAADLVDPDMIATLLDTHRADAPLVDTRPAGTADAPDTAETAPAMPSVDDVAAVRNGIRHWPRERRGALLLDAARAHTMADLATLLTQLGWIRDRVDQALPVRVDDLRTLCRRHVPVLAPTPPPTASGRTDGATAPSDTDETAGTPAAGRSHAARRTGRAAHAADTTSVDDTSVDRTRVTATPGTASRPGTTRATAVATVTTGTVTTGPGTDGAATPRTRRRALLPAQPMGAPRLPSTVTPGTPIADVRWPIPPALLTLHRHVRNGITFDVPTSALELRDWGLQMRNCIGSFSDAMYAGHTWLVGLRRDDVLIGCVEINPHSRRVVQATGHANRALPLWVQRTVVDTLVDLRVTRPD